MARYGELSQACIWPDEGAVQASKPLPVNVPGWLLTASVDHDGEPGGEPVPTGPSPVSSAPARMRRTVVWSAPWVAVTSTPAAGTARVSWPSRDTGVPAGTAPPGAAV